MGLNVDELFGSFMQFYGLGQNLGARQDLRGLAETAPQRKQTPTPTAAGAEQMRAMEAQGLPGAESMGGLKQGDYEFLGQNLGPSAPSQELVDQMRQRERANIFENRGMFGRAQEARDRLRRMENVAEDRDYREQQDQILNAIRERGMLVNEGNYQLRRDSFARGITESDRDYQLRLDQFRDNQDRFLKQSELAYLKFDLDEDKYLSDELYRQEMLDLNREKINAQIEQIKKAAQKRPLEWQAKMNIINDPNADPLMLGYALGIPVDDLNDPNVMGQLAAYQLRLAARPPQNNTPTGDTAPPTGAAGSATPTADAATEGQTEIDRIMQENMRLKQLIQQMQNSGRGMPQPGLNQPRNPGTGLAPTIGVPG